MTDYTDPLNGKKWVVIGDSFTHGLDYNSLIPEGPYKGERCVYPYLIANRCGMTVVPFFEGGRTLAIPRKPVPSATP